MLFFAIWPNTGGFAARRLEGINSESNPVIP